ncbi:MAG: HAD family hydrolase [Candidatus Odinarchaeia archaeon]
MSVIIFDGDNTLWGTNKVFTDAQVGSLKDIKELGFDINPFYEFKKLREIDDEFIKIYKKHEYDFTLLFLSLIIHYKDEQLIKKAIKKSIELYNADNKNKDLLNAKKIAYKFVKNVNKLPVLYDGTLETLEYMKKIKFKNIFLSEGNQDRINKIFNKYDLIKYFDEIYFIKKNPEFYYNIKNKYQDYKIFTVGDLLDRDVYYGNLIGAISIYFNSDYKPNQNPSNKYESPNYEIQKINEIIPIIEGRYI